MISKVASDNNKSIVFFAGVLTQEQACNQNGGCTGVKNTATQGWSQMTSKMDHFPVTIFDMDYSNDIKWQNPGG
jgi:hypothetical protein